MHYDGKLISSFLTAGGSDGQYQKNTNIENVYRYTKYMGISGGRHFIYLFLNEGCLHFPDCLPVSRLELGGPRFAKGESEIARSRFT